MSSLKVWKVDLTRQQIATLYVESETQNEAEHTALEVVDSTFWECDFGPESYTTAAPVDIDEPVWRGGENGDWT